MRHISQCLNTQLLDICQHSMLLETLSIKVSAYLPEALVPHCNVASFDKGCLFLAVTDAIWMAQLRYIIPELRNKLRTQAKIFQLSSIKIILATHINRSVK